MGGGKSLVKLTTYTIILFSILSNTVNSARKKSSNIKRAASTKRAATNNTSSTRKTAKRAATSKKKVTPKTTTTAAAANQIKEAEIEARRLKAEAEAEAQKLKAEAEAEKEKLEQEKQLLETEKQKLEEDKQKLEKEKSELEAEKKSAEEAKVKKEAEEKAAAEAEEKRLLALRIKKVEGTDNYTCIDGWTNFVALCETRRGNVEICAPTGSIEPPKLMDSNGVIRDYSNTDTRSTVAGSYILKNLKGCSVKSTEILTFQGMKTYDGSKDYWDEERVFFYDKDNESHTLTFAQILKVKMDEKDVTNDPRTGWTDEEKTRWGGYKPVMGMYYMVTMNRDNIDTAYYAGYGKIEKIRMAGETARDFYDKLSEYTRGKKTGDAFK